MNNKFMLKKLKVDYFRHMHNLSLEFGDNLTIISGLNGTGKSSALGLLGHLFSFRGDAEYRTISGNRYETIYSEIFRFCTEHDISQKYEYSLEFLDADGKEEKLYAHSRYDKAESRFRFYVGQKQGKHGNKYKCPVIFLGLNRLYPTAKEENSVKIEATRLTSKEKGRFAKLMVNILTSLDKGVESENVETKHKKYEGLKTEKYGLRGLSAGQDNLSQIVTALLSFERLDFGSGILLIDELDATLFAAAQINLLKELYGFSKKTNVKVVFTTHSLEIIKYLIESNWQEKDWKINFLELRDGDVVNTVNPGYDYIKNRIYLETAQETKIKKYTILCEDEAAAKWCKNLLSGDKDLKASCSVYCFSGCGSVSDMAKSRLKCFDDFVFVLDADCKDKKEYKNIKNIVFLPGKKAPESEMYIYLQSLCERDEFWGKNNFYKDTCFNGFVDADSEFKHKAWVSKNNKNFGTNWSKFFRRWFKDHIEEKKEFQENVRRLLR